MSYCAPGHARLETWRPHVEHCLEQFGWDPILVGQRLAVCTARGDLRTWVDATRRLIAKADDQDRLKFLHNNAILIYRLKE